MTAMNVNAAAGAVEVVPWGSVRPSTYNPRAADEARLKLVGLSLRKLGWLLPIVATPEGEILSGHQRHLRWDELPGQRREVFRWGILG
jgi:hypothetical protein